jgi:hypothetical protein
VTADWQGLTTRFRQTPHLMSNEAIFRLCTPICGLTRGLLHLVGRDLLDLAGAIAPVDAQHGPRSLSRPSRTANRFRPRPGVGCADWGRRLCLHLHDPPGREQPTVLRPVGPLREPLVVGHRRGQNAGVEATKSRTIAAVAPEHSFDTLRV